MPGAETMPVCNIFADRDCGAFMSAQLLPISEWCHSLLSFSEVPNPIYMLRFRGLPSLQHSFFHELSVESAATMSNRLVNKSNIKYGTKPEFLADNGRSRPSALIATIKVAH